MWIQSEVLAFTRRHLASRTLSAYVKGGLATPSMRHAARVVLNQQLSHARAELDADEVMRASFDARVAQLYAMLPSDETLHRLGSWVGFIAENGDAVSADLPADLPASVHWGVAPFVVPLLSVGLPEPAFVLLVDAEHAQLSKLNGATLTPLVAQEAQSHLDVGDHMGAPPRAGFHQGTRGATLTEQMQRRRLVAHEQLRSETRQMVMRTLNNEGVLVLAGTTESVRALQRTLPVPILSRSIVAESLSFETASGEIVPEVRKALVALVERELTQWFTRLNDDRRAGGRAALGSGEVSRALSLDAVAHVVMSDTFARQHPDDANRITLQAIAAGGEVTIAPASAGERLDGDASGIAADLRFPLAAPTVLR